MLAHAAIAQDAPTCLFVPDGFAPFGASIRLGISVQKALGTLIVFLRAAICGGTFTRNAALHVFLHDTLKIKLPHYDIFHHWFFKTTHSLSRGQYTFESFTACWSCSLRTRAKSPLKNKYQPLGEERVRPPLALPRSRSPAPAPPARARPLAPLPRAPALLRRVHALRRASTRVTARTTLLVAAARACPRRSMTGSRHS
jgi:hypothetical protein